MQRIVFGAGVLGLLGFLVMVVGCSGNGVVKTTDTGSGGGIIRLGLLSGSGGTQIPVGESLAISVNGFGAEGETIPIGDQTLLWSSSIPSVAEVDADGLVLGKQVGSAIITARLEGTDCSGSLPVEVIAATSPPNPDTGSDNGLVVRTSVDPPSGSGTTNTVFQFRVCVRNQVDQSTITDFLVRWDFNDDGEFDTEFTNDHAILHQFREAGAYTVLAEIKDSEGLTSSAKRVVIVSAETCNQVFAPFNFVPEEGTVETNFEFTFHPVEVFLPNEGGGGGGDQLLRLGDVRWDFDGDGIFDTEFTPFEISTVQQDALPVIFHQYTSPGTYRVTIEVRSQAGCVGTDSRFVTVR